MDVFCTFVYVQAHHSRHTPTERISAWVLAVISSRDIPSPIVDVLFLHPTKNSIHFACSRNSYRIRYTIVPSFHICRHCIRSNNRIHILFASLVR